MAEERSNSWWLIPTGYALFGFLLIFIALVPQSLIPNRFSGPNLILALSFAMVIRRSRILPVWLVALVALIGDFMLSRPLGLNTFLTVIAVEIIRANRLSFLDMFFMMEWLFIGLMIIIMALAQQFMLGFVLLPGFPWVTVLWQVSLTILCYPLMVLMAQILFRLNRRPVITYGQMGAAK